MPVGAEFAVQGDFCADCDKLLKGGMIALVWSDQYAFAESKGSLADFKGAIVHVSEEVFREVKRQFGDKVKTKESNPE
jgi:hypothetical protein